MSDPQQPGVPPYGGTPNPGQQGYGAPGYPPPQPPYQGYDPSQPPYGAPAPGMPPQGAPYPPMAGQMVPGQQVPTPYGVFVVGQKSKMTAGLLGIFLGGFGVGEFYRGNTGIGIAQIAVTVVTCGIGAWWGVIYGILYLTAKPGAPFSLDSDGNLMA